MIDHKKIYTFTYIKEMGSLNPSLFFLLVRSEFISIIVYVIFCFLVFLTEWNGICNPMGKIHRIL